MFFDRLAELLLNPDANFAALREFHTDPGNGIAVPARVFNTMRRHLETWRI